MSVHPDPDIIPNLNREGVFEYLTSVGYVVTRNAIKEAAADGRLKTNRVGHRNLHSRANARMWIHEACLLDRAPESSATR